MNENNQELVQQYITLRDEKEKIKRRYAQDTETVDAAMHNIEIELQKRLTESGTDSMKTKAGSFYITTQTKARVADWQILLGYVKENDAFDLLTKNVSKDAVVQRLNETGEIVPGVDIATFKSVQVRRG